MSKQIKITVGTGWANGEHVDYWDLPENWDKFTDKEKENYLDACANDFLHECCDSHAEVVEEE